VYTKVEVVDPNNPEKPLVTLSVPGEVTTRQIRKKTRVAVSLIIDLGDKRKQKTFTVPILDEELAEKINKYIDDLVVTLTIVEVNERAGEEVRLADIRSE